MQLKKKLPLVILSLALFFMACKNNEVENQEYIRKVKVDQVQKASAEIVKSFSGIIKEADENNLSFRVAGPILKIHVNEGDFVKKGQLIAEIDPRDYKVQAAVAQAQYNQIKSEAGRVRELHSRESVTDNDLDKAIAGEKMLAAQLKNANDQLDDTKLYAPYSGYINKLNFVEKELINTGLPMATLINVSYYKVEVDVPLSVYINRDSFTEYTCTQKRVSNQEIPLKLNGFNKKANSNQLYKLYFELDPKQEPKLAPGMNVEVDISYTNSYSSMISVPVNALFNQEGKSYVWIFNPKTSTVQKKQVKTDGITQSGQIYVVSGLKGTESIVVAGVYTLKDNEKVEIVKAATKTNIGGLL